MNLIIKNLQIPLIMAESLNNTAAAKVLFADSTTQIEPFLINGIRNFFNEKGIVDAKDIEGNTALQYCSQYQNAELAAFLIFKGG